MGKSRKTSTNPTSKINMKTRSNTIRKKSMDNSIQMQNKKLNEEGPSYLKECTMAQNKSKYFPYHEDIDMYFASCFNSNFKSKEEALLFTDKDPNSEKCQKDLKKSDNSILRHDMIDQGGQSQAQSLVNLDEQNESGKSHSSHYSPESPEFGSKMMRIFRTPPSKLEDFKVFDQSEELIRKELIDQLEEVSKQVSSPSENRLTVSNGNNYFQIGNSVFRTEKRIHKSKKKSTTQKIKIEEYFTKPDQREFSFKRYDLNDEVKRRSQILKLKTLKQIHQKYEKSQRILTSLENALKSLMNYYNMRELNTKLLSFRMNVFKALREEIQKMMNSISGKKEICQDTIYEKIKQGNQGLGFYDQKQIMPIF